MASTTYLKRISQDDKTVKKENLKLTAQEASLEISREILATNSNISKLKIALDKANRQIPFDVNQIYKVTNAITAQEEKLAFITKIKEEDFSDATA